MLDGGSLRGVSGLAAEFVFPLDWSNDGHLLYRGGNQTYVWHEGASREVGNSARAVNALGATAEVDFSQGTGQAVLRLVNGEVRRVRDLVGLPPGGPRCTR